MFENLEREEVVTVVDRAVEELLTAARIEGPPVDAIALAQGHLGMTVCLDRSQKQRGRAVRIKRRPHIYVCPEPSEERHQWTIAHEIGEHIKVQLLQRLGISPEGTRPMFGESLANLFAHRLLVPTIWYQDDAPGHDYDVQALKGRYRTASYEVLALRLLDLPEPCIITIVDNEHIHRRRSNVWPVRKELSPPERRCQEYVHYHSRPRRVQENSWTVHGWPVHQADWKREILRSVVEQDF